MTKKFAKIDNARAQVLFLSLNFLFGGIFVADAVVVCLRSLVARATIACQTSVLVARSKN